jgi:hypothetical protein
MTLAGLCKPTSKIKTKEPLEISREMNCGAGEIRTPDTWFRGIQRAVLIGFENF